MLIVERGELEALADKLEATADRPAYRGMPAQSLMRQAAAALRAQAPAVCVSQNGSDVTQAGLSKADETQAPDASGDVVRMGDNLSVIEGLAIRYDHDECDDPELRTDMRTILSYAKRIRAALPTIADARASALEEAARKVDSMERETMSPSLSSAASQIAAAIRKLKANG